MDRLRRLALVASPFLLLAAGFGVLVNSPWPRIFGLMMHGRQVFVPQGWSTTGQLGLSVVCLVAALAVSFNIRRR